MGDPFYQNRSWKENNKWINIQSIHSVCAPQIITKVIQKKKKILHNASCHEVEWGTNGQISLICIRQYQITVSNQHHFLVTSHLWQQLPSPSEQNSGRYQKLVWAKCTTKNLFLTGITTRSLHWCWTVYWLAIPLCVQTNGEKQKESEKQNVGWKRVEPT